MTDATGAPAVRRWPIAFVTAGYLLLAFAAAWPLTADLDGLLPGGPSGDTGIYVWNLWVFRHELVGHSAVPLWTDHILQPGPAVDLALHNYTIFQDVLALGLIPWLGLVASFNVIWISMQALSGVGVFLLARRYTLRDGVAFLAGALFAFSPTIVARSTAHQSLVAAAPLAFFLLFALRAAERRSWSDAVLAGACAAWAGLSDAYYGVYCILILLVVAGVRVLRFERQEFPRGSRGVATFVNTLIAMPLVVIAAILVTGGGRIDLFGVTIRAGTLYTPVLVLTLLVAVRAALALRARGRWRMSVAPDARRIGQLVAGTIVCGVLIAPLVNAAGQRIAEGGLQQPVFWRSSPPGVDLLWFLVPNPGHLLAPEALREFVTTRPDSYAENVATIPYVAIVMIAMAVARSRPPKMFVALALCFGLLALGPFVTIAHLNTHVPGPWALLRYLPVLGAARTPTRFAIPMLIAVAVLFAWALDRVARRRSLVAVTGALLAFELLPVPRVVASAAVPRAYNVIMGDPRDIAVLELPFGVRDGTGGIGRFDTAVLFYQTRHQQRLLTGYLSRVPPDTYRRVLADPFLAALAALSEGKQLPQSALQGLSSDWASLQRRAEIGYVVVNEGLCPPQLLELVGQLPLTRVTSSGPIATYSTRMAKP